MGKLEFTIKRKINGANNSSASGVSYVTRFLSLQSIKRPALSSFILYEFTKIAWQRRKLESDRLGCRLKSTNQPNQRTGSSVSIYYLLRLPLHLYCCYPLRNKTFGLVFMVAGASATQQFELGGSFEAWTAWLRIALLEYHSVALLNFNQDADAVTGLEENHLSLYPRRYAAEGESFAWRFVMLYLFFVFSCLLYFNKLRCLCLP